MIRGAEVGAAGPGNRGGDPNGVRPGINLIKLFECFVNNEEAELATAFVSGKLFKPGLIVLAMPESTRVRDLSDVR
jgi:hypothetical protein